VLGDLKIKKTNELRCASFIFNDTNIYKLHKCKTYTKLIEKDKYQTKNQNSNIKNNLTLPIIKDKKFGHVRYSNPIFNDKQRIINFKINYISPYNKNILNRK
jgi:muramoyltetrapeptide carboxypeptidase LdcA involved in peptidoglycan recycling